MHVWRRFAVECPAQKSRKDRGRHWRWCWQRLYLVRRLWAYLLSEWIKRSTTTKRISIATVLPSGICFGKFLIRIAEGRCDIITKVEWPKPLCDLDLLHSERVVTDGPDKIMKYNPDVLCFEAALKSKRAQNSNNIESIAKNPLLFSVQTYWW